MPDHRPEVVDFLLTRRSRPAKTLTGPGPDRATIETILAAAARTPDHGKLEPWRFVVLTGAALPRLSALTRQLGEANGLEPEKCAKDADAFDRCPAVIAVIAAPVSSPKIPEIEQTLSAGAVCLAALNAALALGWGANWLSSWMAYDRAWLTQGLSLGPHEWVAGFIHLGTETSAPPERPRPDMARVTTWQED
ncbi:MAG: nitroreductase [Paracoccaceae bacterium]|jgi:nitroreductase